MNDLGKCNVMKKVLFMHTGSGNHGCEAILRTTAGLLGGPDNVVLWSMTKSEDEKYGAADSVEKIVVSEQIRKFSTGYFSALFKRKILHNQQANMQVFLRELFKGNIAVSIGGDNYCYPWSAKQAVEFDKEIRKFCKYSVLWGCSIDPEVITPELADDLAAFDLITAREPITYERLKKINKNTVKVADPAFLLEQVDCPLPEKFIEGNTVGVNVSPLIMKYGTEDNLILGNYELMIRYIIDHTNMNICLIPHVVWDYNNDLEPINLLYNKFEKTGRVCKIEDGNCCELKGYIARCRFFVGARTHATIAAYSSCVPTLVVGYSVKSRGIAQDLFGTDKNYVIAVQNLKNEKELVNHFIWLMRHEEEQKELLGNKMPDYKEQAKQAAIFLEQMIG